MPLVVVLLREDRECLEAAPTGREHQRVAIFEKFGIPAVALETQVHEANLQDAQWLAQKPRVRWLSHNSGMKRGLIFSVDKVRQQTVSLAQQFETETDNHLLRIRKRVSANK